MAAVNDLTTKHILHCGSDDCPFRIALIILHNICSIGMAKRNNLIPKWILILLNKYAKNMFLDCYQICKSLNPSQIQQLWNTLHKIGKPTYFIHIAIDDKLTPKSHNALISLQHYDDINSITTTTTGKQLMIDYNILNKALLSFNKTKTKSMKQVMLYNNMYKKWIDRVFITKEAYCKEYIKYQVQSLCNQLTIKYNVPYCFIRYSINKLLIQCGNTQNNQIKELLNITNLYDDNGQISFNALFDGLNIDKFVNKNIKTLMDYSSECNQDDHILHTFKILKYNDNEWINDKQRGGCSYIHCKVFFNSIQRRHHCRGCGDIFCDKHLYYIRYKRNIKYDAINKTNNNNKKSKIKINDEERVKVCNHCKTFYWYFCYKVPSTSHGAPYLS